jgi:outer membrane immunogenic protein
MKKLVLALVATTVAASAASANIGTGFYLGGHLGWGNVKAKLTDQSAAGAAAGTADIGNDAGNLGIHGGYGFMSGCWYFGGELFYTFENIKARTNLGVAVGTSTELKRNGYYGLALRAGFVFNHNTMFFVRLGGHMGKWQLRDSAFNFNAANPGTASKNRFNFAPGVGIEHAINKNLWLRGEWFYEFGPSIRATNSAFAGDVTNAGNIRYNSFRLGLSYKF